MVGNLKLHNYSWGRKNEEHGWLSVTITKELISKVIGIPIMGRKFYRDHNFLDDVNNGFLKDPGESEALVKQESKTYFQPTCIKKL